MDSGRPVRGLDARPGNGALTSAQTIAKVVGDQLADTRSVFAAPETYSAEETSGAANVFSREVSNWFSLASWEQKWAVLAENPHWLMTRETLGSFVIATAAFGWGKDRVQLRLHRDLLARALDTNGATAASEHQVFEERARNFRSQRPGNAQGLRVHRSMVEAACSTRAHWLGPHLRDLSWQMGQEHQGTIRDAALDTCFASENIPKAAVLECREFVEDRETMPQLKAIFAANKERLAQLQRTFTILALWEFRFDPRDEEASIIESMEFKAAAQLCSWLQTRSLSAADRVETIDLIHGLSNMSIGQAVDNLHHLADKGLRGYVDSWIATLLHHDLLRPDDLKGLVPLLEILDRQRHAEAIKIQIDAHSSPLPRRAAQLLRLQRAADCALYLGLFHPATLEARRSLTASLVADRRPEGALSIVKGLIADSGAVFGPTDRRTIEVREHYAQCLRKEGRLEDSRREFEEVLRFYKGKDSERAEEYRVSLDLSECHRLEGDPASGLGIAHSVLQKPGVAGQPNALRWRADAEVIANLLKLGETENARSAAEVAASNCLLALGADHPATLRLRADLAMTQWVNRDVSQAAQTLRASFESQVEVLGFDHELTERSIQTVCEWLETDSRNPELSMVQCALVEEVSESIRTGVSLHGDAEAARFLARVPQYSLLATSTLVSGGRLQSAIRELETMRAFRLGSAIESMTTTDDAEMLPRLREHLQPDECLVYLILPSQSDGFIQAIVIPPTTAPSVIRSEITMHEVDGWVFAATAAALFNIDVVPNEDSHADLHHELAVVSGRILGAVRETVAPDTTLLLVPCGSLALLPFQAALVQSPRGLEPLSAEYPIAALVLGGQLLTRASQLSDDRNEPPCMAIPPAPSMPFTSLEALVLPHVRGMTAAWGTSQPRPRPMDVHAARTVLEQSRDVHVACHGRADLYDELRTHLVLLEEAGPAYQLAVGDVESLVRRHRGGELFIAACSARTPGLRIPNEVAGFPTTFLRAGFRTVISAGWPVDDLAAALVSIAYHRNRNEGQSPPRALRAAQLWLKDLTAANVAMHLRELEDLVAAGGSDVGRFDEWVEIAANYSSAGHAERPFVDPKHWGAFALVGC